MVDAHARAKAAPAGAVSPAPPPTDDPAPPPTQPGQRSGAAGLKPGDEGYRAPHNDVQAVVGDAAAAANARLEAAAQKRQEDRERQLAEQRAGAEAAGGTPC